MDELPSVGSAADPSDLVGVPPYQLSLVSDTLCVTIFNYVKIQKKYQEL